jgi:hypothetical protein
MTDPQMAQTGVHVDLKVFPLAPGNHTLRCYLPYLWYRDLGDSSTEVMVVPGTIATVQWRTSWLVFLRGKWKTVTTP